MTADLAAKMHERLLNDRFALDHWNRYYEGKQPLSYMAPELLRELEGRVRQVVINWPRLVVDALEERLDVEGFRLDDRVDERIWGWWQANDLDERSQMAHVDALAMGRSFVIVGSRADDPEMPLITVESPQQVAVRRDPRTGAVIAAIKSWREGDRDYTTLYLPGQTQFYRSAGAGGGFEEYADADIHNLPVVPVVPIVNRARVMDPSGVSELADIVPLSDAACKIATDMMISAEFHAIPRMVALGMTEADFTDADGRPVSKWEKIAGRIWATESQPGEADVKQLPEADLRNFHETLNSLARLVSSLAGLPPHYLGYSDANPASADAIRSSETRLVKRAERRQRAFGGSWEQVMRLAFLVVDGELPDGSARMETVWRDAATPTAAQTADALVKLAAGLAIPPRVLWEKIPGVSHDEAARWTAIADAQEVSQARAQATAFGVLNAVDDGDA